MAIVKKTRKYHMEDCPIQHSVDLLKYERLIETMERYSNKLDQLLVKTDNIEKNSLREREDR